MSEETTYYHKKQRKNTKQSQKKHNEVLKERARNKYRELSEEEKNKR